MYIVGSNNIHINSTGYSNNRKNSSVSFKAMKKSQFSGFDLAVVEKFKAPIEKFNAFEDFQIWTQNLIEKFKLKEYLGRADIVENQRKYVLKHWKDYVTQGNKKFSNSVQLTILSDITKNLKINNDNVPLNLNKTVLSECIAELEAKLKEQPEESFNFYKLYSQKLTSFYLQEERQLSNNKTGWIIIPSKT